MTRDGANAGVDPHDHEHHAEELTALMVG